MWKLLKETAWICAWVLSMAGSYWVGSKIGQLVLNCG